MARGVCQVCKVNEVSLIDSRLCIGCFQKAARVWFGNWCWIDKRFCQERSGCYSCEVFKGVVGRLIGR